MMPFKPTGMPMRQGNMASPMGGMQVPPGNPSPPIMAPGQMPQMPFGGPHPNMGVPPVADETAPMNGGAFPGVGGRDFSPWAAQQPFQPGSPTVGMPQAGGPWSAGMGGQIGDMIRQKLAGIGGGDPMAQITPDMRAAIQQRLMGAGRPHGQVPGNTGIVPPTMNRQRMMPQFQGAPFRGSQGWGGGGAA